MKNKKTKKESTPRLAAVTHFPTPISSKHSKLTEEEKVEAIADHFKEIMEILGLDLADESLAKTPQRVARMYVQEIFSGLDLDQYPSVSFITDHYKHEDKSNLVFMKVHFTSFCEHHFVPMIGVAYVAYVPHRKIIGLSKIPRIVRYFARRPQVQERLTAQIADSLSIVLETKHVAVSLVAEHYCILARGIEDNQSHAITNVLRGDFEKNESLRREFFESINRRFE
jgi:GTP cyclohydrolase IA